MSKKLVCAVMQPIVGTHSQHRCKEEKGHEPLWHKCTCGHVWRPVPLEIIHKVPRDGEGATPCCGKPPFELPRGDRLTQIDDAVTCKGPVIS